MISRSPGSGRVTMSPVNVAFLSHACRRTTGRTPGAQEVEFQVEEHRQQRDEEEKDEVSAMTRHINFWARRVGLAVVMSVTEHVWAATV